MKNPRCFVICPFDNRAGKVFDFYIKPACEGSYEVPYPQDQSSPTITEPMLTALRDDPLVVAYIGSPVRGKGDDKRWYWNANVMFEVGYRLGLGKPIVILRSARKSDDEPLLPFDLQAYRTVELPTEEEEEDRATRKKVEGRIKGMVEALETDVPPPDTFTFAGLIMEFGHGGGIVKEANADAASLFGFESAREMIGLDVRVLVKRIGERIAPSQRSPYQREQERLLGQIAMGDKPNASVCLVLSDKALAPGDGIPNAYLPMVAKFQERKGRTRLEVVYPSVKRNAAFDEDGVVRCYIGEEH